MPALRKPTAVLEVSGAFKKHPARTRKNEPQAGGVGPAPDDMPVGQRAIWDEVVSNCAPGVFQSGDRVMLEALVTLIAQFRADRAGFGGRKYQQLMALLVRCGMTPADRSRVSVSHAKPEEKPKVGLASFR